VTVNHAVLRIRARELRDHLTAWKKSVDDTLRKAGPDATFAVAEYGPQALVTEARELVEDLGEAGVHATLLEQWVADPSPAQVWKIIDEADRIHDQLQGKRSGKNILDLGSD
jgi:hypothetical protein